MNCLVCGGRMNHQEQTTFIEAFEEDGETFHVMVTDVPADVCGQCGEKVYSAEVTDQVLRVVQGARERKPSAKTVEVPLYSLAKPG